MLLLLRSLDKASDCQSKWKKACMVQEARWYLENHMLITADFPIRL